MYNTIKEIEKIHTKIVKMKSITVEIKNTIYEIGFSWWLSGKESMFPRGDQDLIPESGRSHGEGNDNPVFLPGESPWTEEPGKLQSMGSQRLGQN